MADAKHTPGPWELARNDQHAGSIATLYGCEGGYIEVWTTKWPAGVNQEANARLIAAAPELLEALQSIVDDHEFCGNSWGDRREAWIATARAALAKAEGRDHG